MAESVDGIHLTIGLGFSEGLLERQRQAFVCCTM